MNIRMVGRLPFVNATLTYKGQEIELQVVGQGRALTPCLQEKVAHQLVARLNRVLFEVRHAN